ncbi:hypothetical protein NIE79_002047 [Micromonospora sp. NIE79]|uniref:Peptidase n=1 Tax=Micromonospora trifolii TaxID=2911208 RepID=A0ABS9N236_9ACTN|nr:hypothetical protein [Micromonospora trifolii]MCG5443903.1 hypothetical protein [Micromonospora trifolii]
MREVTVDPYEAVEESAIAVEREALRGLAAQRSIARLWTALALWVLIAGLALVLVIRWLAG